MSNVGFIWFLVFHVCYGDVELVNLSCRDNDNRPVDWWSIYKPPTRSFAERGRYFVFLTPYSEGRWEPSDQYITSSSMLMNTMEPMFRLNPYENKFATVIYTERTGDKGSTVNGILLADDKGGIWISHTVPGLPDINRDKPTFPDAELKNGHMMTCMTLDHAALDGIMKVVAQTDPKFMQIRVPANMEQTLPSWTRLRSPLQILIEKSKVVEFFTRQRKLNPILLVRKPGDSHSLYEMFAKAKKIVLDVYGEQIDKPVCSEYGVRKIQSISLKFPDEVHYVNNSTDRATFAVSTAAHWQTTGTGPTQYWSCVGSYQKPTTSRTGRILMCIQNYDVWTAFDNLKVKEPSCIR